MSYFNCLKGVVLSASGNAYQCNRDEEKKFVHLKVPKSGRLGGLLTKNAVVYFLSRTVITFIRTTAWPPKAFFIASSHGCYDIAFFGEMHRCRWLSLPLLGELRTARPSSVSYGWLAASVQNGEKRSKLLKVVFCEPGTAGVLWLGACLNLGVQAVIL